MKYCHTCSAQFPDSESRCLHCQGRLSPRGPGSNAEHPLSEHESELVLLARRQPAKAVPLLEQLRAAQIPFQVTGDGGTQEVNWRGSYGTHAAVEVHVHPQHLERAEAIIRAELSPLAAELSHSSTEAGVCPACHHSLPDSAHECPDCGLVFPE